MKYYRGFLHKRLRYLPWLLYINLSSLSRIHSVLGQYALNMNILFPLLVILLRTNILTHRHTHAHIYSFVLFCFFFTWILSLFFQIFLMYQFILIFQLLFSVFHFLYCISMSVHLFFSSSLILKKKITFILLWICPLNILPLFTHLIFELYSFWSKCSCWFNNFLLF